MSFPQLGYQYIRSIYPTEREEIGSDRAGTDLSPTGALSNVLSTMCASPFAAAQGYGAFLPYSNDLSIFNQLGTQFELKDTPGAQHPGFAHHPPTFYPYGQYQFGDPSRPKNATRESTSTLKAWLSEHRKNPYPTKGEKIMLAILTKMTLTQVSTWFANARRRLKKENKMSWTHRSRTDEEGNIYRCDHEGDERDMRDDDEEIDLENIDTEKIENKDDLDDQDDVPADVKLDVRSESEIADGSEDLERSDQRFFTAVVKEGNDIYAVRHDHCLQYSLEIKATPPGEDHLKLNALSINPTSSENIAASAQKPKIWSLAETATAPDIPRRSPLIHRNPAETLAQTLIGHRRLLSCPFGKLQNWTNQGFSFHELSLLNSSHYLGLASQAFANCLVMYGRQAEERTHKSESFATSI